MMPLLQDGVESFEMHIISIHIGKCTRMSISGIDLRSFPPPQAEWAVLKACRSTVLLLCGRE